jgi:GT2 family glycosyltransferase
MRNLKNNLVNFVKSGIKTALVVSVCALLTIRDQAKREKYGVSLFLRLRKGLKSDRPRSQIDKLIVRLSCLIRSAAQLRLITIINYTRSCLIGQPVGGGARLFYTLMVQARGINDAYLREAYPSIVDQDVLDCGPLISVIVPAHKTPPELLEAAINSVVAQLYAKWELIIVDDKSESLELRQVVAQAQLKDGRIKFVERKAHGHIAKTLNDGLREAQGQWFVVLDHDDKLHDAALYWVAHTVISNPTADYIYSDEDKIDKSGTFHYGPFFKPDWCPEYILGMMYTCHLSAYRTDFVGKLGGYRDEFRGAQDYDLMLRVTSHTDKIFHIPHVLYHWRVWENSTAQTNTAKPYAKINAVKALREHLSKQSGNVKVEDHQHEGHYKVTFLPTRFPLVSIVIPTANGHVNVGGRLQENLRSVCESIKANTSYPHYEIVVAHNGDLSVDQLKWLQSSTQIKAYKYEDSSFNLARKINNAVRLSHGEYVLLMNDDVRVKTHNWLELMAGIAERPGVGVVGPRLLFPNGTVQHAGVVLLGGLPGHAYYEWPCNAFGYAMGLQLNRGYSAVTGACCLTPRSLFDRLAGFSERYRLNYNDVDYCLRARELGYRSVYLADVELYHYEGVSKDGGRSVSTEEINMFLSDWGGKYVNDPMYNPNLSQSMPYGDHN